MSYSHKKKLKAQVLGEIKKQKWKSSISEEEYKTKTKIFEEIRQKSLEKIKIQNENFNIEKVKAKTKVSKSKYSGISRKAIEEYNKWKQTVKKKEYPEVHTETLLYLLQSLNKKPVIDIKKQEIDECLRRQNSNFETFWDSPSCILKALRQCVLKRDWPNMAFLSVILLNYDKKYLPTIKNMCRIMLKFYPLIRQCGLEDQFKILTEESANATIIA